ncbi:hypothetical protein JOM56_003625 [Amanita muscaria]
MRGEHHDIWSTHVNQIPRLSHKHKLSSGPPTPVFATFANIPRAPSLVAPVPRPFRTFPMDDIYQRHSGFDPEYGIEGFEQQVHVAPRPIQRLPALSIPGDNHRPAPSFYPQFIQCALQSDPEAQQQPLSALERQGPLAQRMPSPPPLANWPRHDVLSRPVKSKCAKNPVDPIAANVSQHPLGPRGMSPSPDEGHGVGGAGP